MRPFLITVITLLVTAACGDAATDTTVPPATLPPPTTTTTTIPLVDFPLPDDPGAVVVRIDKGINQPDPVAVSIGYPIFTLYGDGRLIVENRDQEPLPGLPPLVELRVSRDGMQQLVNLATLRGTLDPLDSYGSPAIADADSTSFFVDTGAGQLRFGAYALGSGGADDEGLSDEQRAGRRQLIGLRTALLSYEEAVAEEILEPARPYRPEAVAIVGDSYSAADGSFPELPVDLTSGTLIDTRVAPAWCLVVTGADLDAVLAALADTDTPRNWSIGDREWRVGFRPMLPDDTGCESLADR